MKHPRCYTFGLALVGNFLTASSVYGRDIPDDTVLERIVMPDLINILPSLELLKETQTGSGLMVRVFRTTSSGECDPGHEATTCPHTRLLLVSGINEEGMKSAAIWGTSSLIGWEIDELSLDKDTHARVDAPTAVVLETTVCKAPLDVETGKKPAIGGSRASPATWWRKIRYRLVIGLETISAKQVGEPGGYCDLY